MNLNLQIFNQMRVLLLVSGVLVLATACHKNNGNDPRSPGQGDIDYTSSIQVEKVTTDIVGYISNDQNQTIPTPVAYYLMPAYPVDAHFMLANGTVSTGSVNSDKTMTWSMVEPGGGWNYLITQKTFAVSSALKSYTRIKMLNRISIGTVTNVTGGTFNFGNNGSIAFGSNTLCETATPGYPGFFGPNIRSNIHITYFDPEHKEFAQRLPCYLAADDGQERWFLKSYGAFSMELIAENWVNNSNVDFYSNGTADVKLPIPSTMQTGAPDSIIAWKLINGKWTKGGTAVKQGNFYIGKINKSTAWNFAVPVKGVYLTVKARMDSATITNTAVRIKSNGRTIAESMTDANGDALCFVPSNEALVAEVLPDERAFSSYVFSNNLSPLTKKDAVTLNLPGPTIYHLSTLFGKIFNCNNQPIVNGMLKLNLWGDRQYYFPIKDGKMGSSVWLYGSGTSATAQITDYSTGSQGDPTNLLFLSYTRQKMNLYTCASSTKLYCNYSVDNMNYELNDDATSSSLFMTCSKASQYADPLLKTHNGSNIGVNFSSWPASYGIHNGVTFQSIVVNGVSYQLDVTMPPTLVYSRFDATGPNSYVEGWFSFNYIDNSNVSHHVEGSFKLKKTF
jgi:hypothetical protein